MSRYAAVKRVFEEMAPPTASVQARAAGAQKWAETFRGELGLVESASGVPSLQRDRAKMNASEWSLRGLAEAICGYEWAESLNSSGAARFKVYEATGNAAMTPGNFPNVSAFLGSVTGLLDASILEGYQKPEYKIDSLVEVVPSKTRQHSMLGMGRIGDQSKRRNPGDPYPRANFGERYVRSPETQQDALSCEVTFEAVYFDQTGMVLDKARSIGDELGLRKELDGFSVIAGITNPYNYNGTSYNTYLTSGNWINDVASNEMVDWSNVNVVKALFSRMTDQETGNRIAITWDTAIVAPAKVWSAQAVLNATQVRTGTNSGNTQTYSANIIGDRFNIVYSEYLDQLLTAAAAVGGLALTQTNADKYWWAIKTGKGGAFRRIENWGITINQAAPNDYTMLNHKLLLAVFADQMHIFMVNEPRYVIRSKN